MGLFFLLIIEIFYFNNLKIKHLSIKKIFSRKWLLATKKVLILQPQNEGGVAQLVRASDS